MPVEVIWDDEAKTIIRQIYSGRVILDDYYKATDQFVKLANSVDYTVHSIMDRQDVLISEGSYLQVMRYANKIMPDNIGIRAIIKANVMTRMMINIGSRLAPRLVSQIRLVNNLEEARQVIEANKASTS